MKEFDWEEFKDTKNKIAVHCKTEEEAKDFCKQMHEHGMKWANRDSYLKKTNFEYCKDKTCYHGIGGYSDLDYALRNEYAILEWSDYMQKEFTKADLKYGYLVVMRNGNKAIYMPSIKGNTFDFQNNAECILLDKYNDTLNYTVSKNYDVMKVCGLAHAYETTSFDLKRRSLVWEREENKRMTVEEMRVKLEELTGEKIEVEVSRNEMIAACYRFCELQGDGCWDCQFKDIYHGCYFGRFPDKELKQCYEKVMENGNN